jgi:hypothetical protein
MIDISNMEGHGCLHDHAQHMIVESEHDDHWVFGKLWDFMGRFVEPNYAPTEFADYHAMHPKIRD